MKKALVLLAVCSMATAAMATVPAGFDILGGPTIEIQQGQSVWIPISVTSAGDVQGLNLNVGVYTNLDTMDFRITDVDLLTGTVWTANDNFSGKDTQYGDAAVYTVTTGSTRPICHIEPGQLIGLVQVQANGPIGTLADFTTNYTREWSPSTWAGSSAPVTHDTVSLKIVPEPAAALLLLAGMPLIRRRRA